MIDSIPATEDTPINETILIAACDQPDVKAVLLQILCAERKRLSDEAGRIGRRMQQVNGWIEMIQPSRNAIDNLPKKT